MERQAFLANLSQSRLLSREQIAEVSQRFGAEDLTEQMVSSLVQEGKLTSFQVQQLLAGQTKGLVLGQYRILDELGRGGYGRVYKARHNLMDRVVALKVITPHLVEDNRIRAWFRREVLAATQLNHPNIALAYDADEVDGILFFAMEYIDGPNLDTLVRQQGPVPIALACELLQQTARALQYAHEKEMVHRDIKPANLLIPRGPADLAPQGQGSRQVLVKVVDFGLARLHNSTANNTLVLHNEKGFVGTPAYVSPEQARNVHDVDIRSDLYSLGCTFYFALTGRPPFQAATVMETVVQHLEKEPAPLENYRGEIPPALASMVRRLMAKKPDKRFQTPAELLAELGFFFGMGPRLPNFIQPTNDADSEPKTAIAGQEKNANFEEEDNLVATRVVPANVEPGQELAGDGKRISSGTLIRPALEIPEKLEACRNGSPCIAPQTVSLQAISQAIPKTDNSGPQIANPEPPVLDVALMEDWRQWTDLVEVFLKGGNPPIQQQDYLELYQRLLAGCRSHSRRPLLQKMAEVVEPWLTLPVLASTDHETLASLLRRCRQIDFQLGLTRRNFRPLAVLLICLILAVGITGLMTQASKFRALPFLGSLWSFLESHPILSLAVLLPLLILAAVTLLGRLLRL